MAGGGSLESEGGGFEGECDSCGGDTTAMRKKAAAFSIKAVLRVRTTEQSLYSEYTDRAIGFLFPLAFGGSIPMKLQSNLVSF